MNTTNASLKESPIPIRKEDFGEIINQIPVIRSGIEIRRGQIHQSQQGHFNPQHSPQKRNRLGRSPCSHMAHPRFYSAHCSHPATAPGAAQACPLCLPSGSNQRTCVGHPRLSRPVEKSFRFALRTSQLGSFIPGTARSLPSPSRVFHIPDHAGADLRTCKIHPPICHFAAGVSGFPAPAIRFGQIGAPVMTTGFRVVHLNGPDASLPIQINASTSRPADCSRLLDFFSLMSIPCSGRQGLRPLAPPLLTGAAHQLTCPTYTGLCRPIERAVRSASVPSQFGCLTFLHPAFRPAPVRNLAPVALIYGHCSGRRARRFLGPSAIADAASQRSFPELSGSIRPFSPSSLSPKPQLRTQRKGGFTELSPGTGSHLSSILSCIVSQTKASDHHGSPDLINPVRRSNVTRDSDFRTKSPGGKNSVFPSVLRASGALRKDSLPLIHFQTKTQTLNLIN